jgi:hypothetical protein
LAKKTHSGAGAEEVESSWAYFNELNFLEKVLEDRPRLFEKNSK